jgi:drug/metabolite transporter (DMT)-like permease
MVLFSGALAMWFYYQGLKKLSARTTAIAEMFFPFFSIIVNWVFLGKQLTELQLVGGGILILGSLIIQLKKY